MVDNRMSFMTAFWLIFLFYWAFTAVGFLSVRFGNPRAAQLARQCWNARIDKLNMEPYSRLISAMERKDYRGTAAWVVVLNAGMAALLFGLGLLLLVPFVAGFAGMMAGYLFSFGDRRALFPYALFAVTFEYAAFSAAGATGMVLGAEWILTPADFEQVITGSVPQMVWGLGLSLVLLTANGLAEAARSVRYGISNIPPLEAVRGKKYLDLS